MYLQGQGVERDFEEAFFWAHKSAESGSAEGQNTLGVIYLQGWGVESDVYTAASLIRAAAEGGNAAAQHNLGKLCENGSGLSRYRSAPLKWFSLADEQGQPEGAGPGTGLEGTRVRPETHH